MRVAIIDVGSNTARLLVANVTGKGAVVPIAEERDYLRLGAEIERTGTLSAEKIAAAADTCSAYARMIAELDVERATVIVTAPGRQGAAASELTAALADATSMPVRVLTAESEGRLAYDGAFAESQTRTAVVQRREEQRVFAAGSTERFVEAQGPEARAAQHHVRTRAGVVAVRT